MSGALLVAGTTSDAGKSVVTAGICRWLARQGVSVAPFKAQNMSNNSMVTADGAEIGRAQVMQAAAAAGRARGGDEPGAAQAGRGERQPGRRPGQAGRRRRRALSYRPMKAALLEQALACLADLRSRFDVVVCEGAGSPTEINLRADDIANMGLATAGGAAGGRGRRHRPRRGLRRALRHRRADAPGRPARWSRASWSTSSAATPGCSPRAWTSSRRLTGRPALGVLPCRTRPAPRRRGLAWASTRRAGRRCRRTARTCCGCRSPGCPGCPTSPTSTPSPPSPACCCATPPAPRSWPTPTWSCCPAPGPPSPTWAGSGTGLADAVAAPRRRRAPGARHLRRPPDAGPHDHRRPRVPGRHRWPGWGCCRPTSASRADKVLARPAGAALGHAVRGYEIHHGVVTVDGPRGTVPWTAPGWGRSSGRRGTGRWRTTGSAGRSSTEVAAARPAARFVAAPDTDFAAVREARLDALGDLVAEHADTDALWRLIEGGAAGRPAGAAQRTRRPLTHRG